MQHEIEPVLQTLAVEVVPGAVEVTVLVTVTVLADVVGTFQGVATARRERANKV